MTNTISAKTNIKQSLIKTIQAKVNVKLVETARID